jgi:hypothetical protein
MVLDHVNDDPMDNRPENLQEVTQAENQKKRRGRVVYRSYGTSKYGHGIHVHHDMRDGRWYVRRQLSRGHGDGDLKNVRKQLGGFATLAEAEERIKYSFYQVNSPPSQTGPGIYNQAQISRRHEDRVDALRQVQRHVAAVPRDRSIERMEGREPSIAALGST